MLKFIVFFFYVVLCNCVWVGLDKRGLIECLREYCKIDFLNLNKYFYVDIGK